jgi:hypothetical protein
MVVRNAQLGGYDGFPKGVSFRTADINDTFDELVAWIDAGNQ